MKNVEKFQEIFEKFWDVSQKTLPDIQLQISKISKILS